MFLLADRDPWIKFRPDRWMGDLELQSCSIAAQGLMINLMCLMHNAEPYGYLRVNGESLTSEIGSKLLRLHHKTYLKLFSELTEHGVLKLDQRGYYSQRMIDDYEKRLKSMADGAKGGNPQVKGRVNPPVNPDKDIDKDIDKENTTSGPEPSDTAVFVEGDEPYDLALDLHAHILENNRKALPPKPGTPQFQKWALCFDRMIRLDHRSPDDIYAVMKWCQNDGFWKSVILSPIKLRKQYDQLYLKSRS